MGLELSRLTRIVAIEGGISPNNITWPRLDIKRVDSCGPFLFFVLRFSFYFFFFFLFFVRRLDGARIVQAESTKGACG